MARDESEPIPRGPVDIEALRPVLESIGSWGGPEFILQPRKELFHYTDLNGMIGMLQSGDLWLTHSRYSNDEEEMVHGPAGG